MSSTLRDANLRLCRLRMWSGYDGFGFDLKSSSKPPHIIQFVEPYSPAAAGGLQALDAVLAINNQDVSSTDYDELIAIIAQTRDNTGRIEFLVVEKRIYRSLVKKNIKIDAKDASVMNTPQRMPIEYQNYLKCQPRSCKIYLHRSDEQFGFDIADDDDEIGAYIERIRPNTPASRTILRPNDRIIEINNKSVDTKLRKSIFKKLERAKLRGYVKLYVMDVNTYQYYQSNQISLSSKKHRKKKLETLNITDRQSKFPDSSSAHSNGAIYVRKKCYSGTNENSRPSISICQGDLVAQETDVIVVCSLSQYLLDSIFQAGGSFLSDSYNAALKRNSNDSIIAIRASGTLASRQIYFLPWQADSDARVLQKSIEKFVSNAIEKAVQSNYETIAFPAIGCGRFGCSINLVAQTMIQQADRQLLTHSISVVFVIQPDRMDVYGEFQQQIRSLQLSRDVEAMSTTVGKGIIEVEQGDITIQKVDVIISDSSSEILKKAILKAAGNEIQIAYNDEYRKNPNALLITTSSGALYCKRIFFLKWESTADEKTLQQSLTDLMSIMIQNMASYNFTSIAFPAIGCGRHCGSLDITVKTVIREMKSQLIKRDLPLMVKFVIQSDQIDVYNEFRNQLLTTPDDLMEPQVIQYPPTWEKSREGKVRFTLSAASDEYKPIASNFDRAMQGQYTQIIQIERIQNEQWYMQYLAHLNGFQKRLKTDIEKRLYHGCPEQAADSIINSCFNRSFRGVNGTVYGEGVYFSSNASYSHGFTVPNVNRERCMFLVRVLVGKTTNGDTSMITPPAGFDSTTDGRHIFVTYHDAQALAEYLITYK